MPPDSLIDPAVEVARLTRRLERERTSRQEAESISERGLRELYAKQQQLEFLAKIALAANQTSSVAEILQFAVVQICEFTRWEVGHSYLTLGAGGGQFLRSTGLWHAANTVDIREFQRVTQQMEFRSGIGLPGRVLASQKPASVLDVTTDSNFPRRPFALQCGLRGASAFPVLSGQEVVAVLEFFATVVREPDETLLDLMAQVGLQLGRVIERQRAEERSHNWTQTLKDSEARFRDFAESASDWFWEQDEHLRFTYISRSSLASGDDVVGKTRRELLESGRYSVANQELWHAHEELIRAKRPFQNLRLQRVTADGSSQHVSISGRPIFDEKGKFLGYRGAGRDATSEVAVEIELTRRVAERTAELQQAQAELLRTERLTALGQVTASVAHELRNPLSAIKNTIFVLREAADIVKSPVSERQFDRLMRSIARCDGIINELLDYSRTPKLSRRSIGFDSWLAEVIAEQTKPDGIVVIFDLAASGAVVRLDEDRFRRVIVNLFDNAVQAMAGEPATDTASRLLLRSRVSNRTVDFSIEDNGPGIAPDNLARVFEPLFSTKSFGTGLGLPIVKQIIEQHDGKIALSSTVGVGTTILIRLPLAEADA